MITLEKLANELKVEKIDEVLGGFRTSNSNSRSLTYTKFTNTWTTRY